MNFIDRYLRFCSAFYITVLGLTIPIYAGLYYVTGFQFHPTTEEVIWIAIVIGSFLVALRYLTLKEKEGFRFNLLRLFFSLTLVLTTYGCVRLTLAIASSDTGDIDFIIRGLFYLIPVTFVLSAALIFLGLFLRRAA